jgi:hypothetical protein
LQFAIALFQNRFAAVLDRRYSAKADWKWCQTAPAQIKRILQTIAPILPAISPQVNSNYLFARLPSCLKLKDTRGGV